MINFINKNRRKKQKPLNKKRDASIFGLSKSKIKSKRTSESKSYPCKPSKLLSYLFLLLIFIFGAFIIYKSADIVLSIRESVNNDNSANSQYELVIGFEDVPVYPYSEFIFKESLEDDKVKEFVNNGFSAYRILDNKSFNEVTEFYNNEMSNLGWEKVLSVPVGDNARKYGEYWVKSGIGIRIYSKINDIWYERISENDAKDGLASEVQMENDREIILAQSDYTNLLPDYPWKMFIPGEYTVGYSSSGVGDLQDVTFKKVDEVRIVSIKIVKIYEGGVLDEYLDLQASKENIEIKNSIPVYLDAGTAIEGEMQRGSESAKMLIIVNSYNNYVYAIYSEDSTNPFYDYVKQNLTPQVKKEN